MKKTLIQAHKDLLQDIINHLLDDGKDYGNGRGFIPLHDGMRQHYINVLKNDYGFNDDSLKYFK